MDAAGWTAIADALDAVTSLTSLNGCALYAGIRAGGQRVLALGGTELGVAVARYLPRSAETLTTLDLRCCGRSLPTLAQVHARTLGSVPRACVQSLMHTAACSPSASTPRLLRLLEVPRSQKPHAHSSRHRRSITHTVTRGSVASCGYWQYDGTADGRCRLAADGMREEAWDGNLGAAVRVLHLPGAWG